MITQNRNFQFLTKCKQMCKENRFRQFIISDKQMSSSLPPSQQQIMVSQYASAMSDNSVSPFNQMQPSRNSTSIMFALINKAIKVKNLELADRILTTALRQQNSNCKNRHILSYNKAKLLCMMRDVRKATFYCQSLLKQSGDGSDYYTYQFLLLLISQGRGQQAFKIASRHMQGSNSNQKHKIQSIYIFLLGQVYENDETKLLKKVQQHFNNKNICIRNWFNLALVLKQKFPEKSLELFKKLRLNIPAGQTPKLQLLIKINILQLYQSIYLSAKSTQIIPKLQSKQILEQCRNIYNQLQNKIQFNEQIEKKRSSLDQNLKKINYQIQNQNNIQFMQSINLKNKDQNRNIGTQTMMTEAEINQQFAKQEEITNQNKYFQNRRAENQKRLKFLLKKQKELKKFFDKLKIQRNGSKLNIKVIDKSIIENSDIHKQQTTLQGEAIEQMSQFQTLYEQKKKKYQVLYENDQINSIINNFIETWVSPNKKQMIKVKNAEKMKQFVFTLDCPIQPIQKQAIPYENNETCRTTQRDGKSSRSSQAFRVKSNTSRKNSEKMLDGLKYNDYITNQIMNNLKSNMSDRKKFDAKQNTKKTFKQLLHEGEQLVQQNKLEEAHEHFAGMYKRFKQNKEKQILLLKIAENFERLSFIAQAQKTYMKCTKFKNTEAFFRLGSLQIRNGQINIGIQNLQKANCIDRHNLRIQIQLVYAYSLMEETTERALALANSILKKNPQCMQALVMTSKILQKKGRVKQALDVALAIGSNMGTASTFHYIGLLYLNDSNVSQAFRYFNRAVQYEPNHHPSLIQIATIISQSKPEYAIEILKNVLSADPNNQLAFARLGKVYETYDNDYENALLIYKKGLQQCPSYENYVKIGDCQFKLGNVVDAYLNYKEALSIKRTPQIFEKIAEVHEFQHQDKKAIQIYATALAELPKNTNSCYLKQKKYLQKLGKLSLANQQYEAAYGYLSQVVEMDDSFETLKCLGQACFGKGDYNEALQYYELAAAKEPDDNLQLLENIAMCLDKQEEYLSSKQIYQKILSIDPKNIKCLNNLANILLILGKTNQAFYWFQFMLQLAPNSIEKRLRVADIYATIGDWSKVQQHLLTCYKQKENDIRIIQRMVNLYKEKRDTKQLTKFEKRLALLKSNTGKVN